MVTGRLEEAAVKKPMTSRARAVLLAALFATATLTSGAGMTAFAGRLSSAAQEAPATASGAPASGGTLVLGTSSLPETLLPFFAPPQTRAEFLGPALRGLFAVDQDGRWVTDLGAAIPSVANGSLALNPKGDGFSAVLELKPGLAWSDGKPLTMEDFAASYDWAVAAGKAVELCSSCWAFVPLLDPSLCVTGECRRGRPRSEDLAARYAPTNQYVKSIDVSADGLSATIAFRKPYRRWLDWASTPFLQAAWLQQTSPDRVGTSIPVGGPDIASIPWSGPFIITHASTDGLLYDRNPHWHAGTPAFLDHLRIDFYADPASVTDAFLAGDVDLTLDTSENEYAALAGVEPNTGRVELYPTWSYEALLLNGGRQAVGLHEPAVRRAIAMAIDKSRLVNARFPGRDTSPACTVAPPGAWWHDESVTCPKFDPVAAQGLLDAAGWTVSPSTGERAKANPDADGSEALRLRLCTISGNADLLALLSDVADDLRAVGIVGDIQTTDMDVLLGGWEQASDCSLRRGLYDIATVSSIGDISDDPYVALASFDKSQIPSARNPSGSNVTRLASKEVDAALLDLVDQVDPVAQKADAAAIERIVAERNNVIPIRYVSAATGISSHVGGWTGYNINRAGPTWNAEHWWFVP
jgi:ABC-type transport system substrate-binding protein